MTIDERLEAIAAIAQQNSEGIKDLLTTTREHTKQIENQSKQIENHYKQLEIDGQHIRQLAMIVHDHQSEIDKMTNGINALLETVALHETRLHGIEGNQ
jgi:chemotaxis regulatin CheY-phosphate phosphatase CheZ